MANTLTFQIISDVHLSEVDQDVSIIPSAPFLLICGDICDLALSSNKVRLFLQQMARSFQKVFWVFGNHELYSKETDATIDELYRVGEGIAAETGVILLNNKTYDICGLRIIGSPLFLHIPGADEELFHKLRMTDAREFKVRDGQTTRYINAQEYNKMTSESLEFLREEVNKCAVSGMKCVIMTHFTGPLPNTYSETERMELHKTNQWFNLLFMAPESIESILRKGRHTILMWAYGHTHRPCLSRVGVEGSEIILVSNPLGYKCEPLCQESFDRALTIRVVY